MGVRVAHTAELTAWERAELREFLDGAFAGRFSDEDFEHCLGGLHVLAREGADGALVAHGSVVQRRASLGERALRVGYVEAVAVRADRRRLGWGGRVMGRLERVVDGGYELGALSASAAGAGLYAARGWWVWPGEVGVLGPRGPERLPEEEGSTWVWAPAGTFRPGPVGRLSFDWRDGDVL
ncbi:GNAT family N-acetyltransferase [Streptomyces sp. BI20]|uniref:GNAT family N-acetyltransferase n=1 Tax=Streptomyces sp. BI20 TaxID=3403460 RepID=UPI003C72B75C